MAPEGATWGYSLHRARYPLLFISLLTLTVAAWLGLIRLGWGLPPLRLGLPAEHGPLMISGFLGTLIGLERAVALAALGKRWAYAAPMLSGLGSLLLMFGLPEFAAIVLITAGSLVLVAVFVSIFRRQPAMFNAVMVLGAAAWATGNVMWLRGQPVYDVVWWWAGYLILTIAGERLELSRLMRVSGIATKLFLGFAGLYLLGLLMLSAGRLFDAALRVIGVSMLALALWLLRYDIARRTVRRTGLTRFIAVNLLLAYTWLAVAGLLAMAMGRVAAGPHYDALLHAVFLGFVFSIIFGHAPIIFPAVLGVQMTYRPAFYGHVILLNLSLLLRLAGDLAGWPGIRQWGGLLNLAALLLFLANTLGSIRRPGTSPAPSDAALG